MPAAPNHVRRGNGQGAKALADLLRAFKLDPAEHLRALSNFGVKHCSVSAMAQGTEALRGKLCQLSLRSAKRVPLM